MKRAYRVKTKSVIHESPNFHFSEKFQKFIHSEIQKKNWIYKIIAGDKEQDQIIFKNENFVILPDTEYLQDAPTLNWMVIFNDLNLTCIRSLEGKHVDMLSSIFSCLENILPADQEMPMIYFHYPPSVWQLHLHIAAPCDNLRTTNSMQKVYFLEDVISNLRIDSNFYQKNLMTYILPSSHEICNLNDHAQKVEKKFL